MSQLKKTKFRAIIKFEEAVHEMLLVGFTWDEIKDILKDLMRAKRISPLIGITRK